jgi:hypothetical protein
MTSAAVYRAFRFREFPFGRLLTHAFLRSPIVQRFMRNQNLDESEVS